MLTTSDLRPVRFARPRLTVRGILKAIAAADRNYRLRQQLGGLDDHLLRDMGLTRAGVAEELRRRR